MVLKFDHVSLISSREATETIIDNFRSEHKFQEFNLMNVQIKKMFMKKWQHNHDLIFFDATEDRLPIEVILYDTVTDKTNVTIDKYTIYGEYSNREIAIFFLNSIFSNKVKFENDIITCNVRGVLDKQDINLVLSPSNNVEVFLDSAGYGAVTVFVNNCSVENSPNILVTEFEKTIVNHKVLQICFAKCDAINIIFELIKMERR